MIYYIILSVLTGVSMVLARNINSALASRIGTLQGTFFNYIVGLVFSFAVLFISKKSLSASGINFESIPVWAYTGGLMGVVVIILSNWITLKVSSFYLTLLIFIGQLFVGIFIDYFTAGELSAGKIIGGILVIAGLTYNLLLDRKSDENALSNSCD